MASETSGLNLPKVRTKTGDIPKQPVKVKMLTRLCRSMEFGRTKTLALIMEDPGC